MMGLPYDRLKPAPYYCDRIKACFESKEKINWFRVMTYWLHLGRIIHERMSDYSVDTTPD